MAAAALHLPLFESGGGGCGADAQHSRNEMWRGTCFSAHDAR